MPHKHGLMRKETAQQKTEKEKGKAEETVFPFLPEMETCGKKASGKGHTAAVEKGRKISMFSQIKNRLI